MPVIKITQTSKGSNKGTCAFLEKYLQKENLDKEFKDQSYWYDQTRDYVARGEVINKIDNNHKGLKKDDAKFFMITINYSEKEIEFMSQKYTNDASFADIKKENCRKVMDAYAKNFNKGLDANDILYFAIDENNRYHKGDSEEVKKGLQKQGSKKEGENDHTHIIVSRKDKSQKLKLSPLTNHKDTTKGVVKGGFNRVDFKLECELVFDKLITYERDFHERAEYLIRTARGEKIEIPQILKKEQTQIYPHLVNIEKEVEIELEQEKEPISEVIKKEEMISIQEILPKSNLIIKPKDKTKKKGMSM